MDERLERLRGIRIATNREQRAQVSNEELSGEAKREFIEQFIREKRLLEYPRPDEELRDENAGLPLKTDDRWGLMEQHVQRALGMHGVAENVEVRATHLTAVVLTSVDPGLLCTVESLPYQHLAVDRVLAHVEVLRLGLPPGLAVAIARRVTLVLLNNRIGKLK